MPNEDHEPVSVPTLVERDAEGGALLLTSSRRVLVALRLVLCAAFVAAVFYGQTLREGQIAYPWRLLSIVLLLVLMLSNVMLLFDRMQRFFAAGRYGWLLFSDVAILSALMVMLGERSPVFLMTSFVTIFIAAIARNVVYAAPIALMTGALYFAFQVLPQIEAGGGLVKAVENLGAYGLLILATRLIFFFSMALFVTYLVQETSRIRARAEALVSWRKAIFQRVVEQEKMASLGQLSAGLAHEINNPVGFIRSNLTTLKEYAADIRKLLTKYREALASVGESEEGRLGQLAGEIRDLESEVGADFLVEDLERVVEESSEGAERLRRIVVDLRTFAHADRAEKELVDVNEVIDKTLNIVWNEIKYKAEVKKDYGTLPRVEAYSNQLGQVFMNLLVNAAQAIEKKGKITIRTRARNNEVEIAISDTGSGISSQYLAHIFTPFFTTKPVGEGSGLGLSVVWGILERHKGRIDVKSKPGQGTTFTVYLPVTQIRTGMTSMAIPALRRSSTGPEPAPAEAAGEKEGGGEADRNAAPVGGSDGAPSSSPRPRDDEALFPPGR